MLTYKLLKANVFYFSPAILLRVEQSLYSFSKQNDVISDIGSLGSRNLNCSSQRVIMVGLVKSSTIARLGCWFCQQTRQRQSNIKDMP